MYDTKGPKAGQDNLTPSLGYAADAASLGPAQLDSGPFGAPGLGCDLQMEFRLGHASFRLNLNTVKGVPEVRTITSAGDQGASYHDINRALVAAKDHLESILAGDALKPKRKPPLGARRNRGSYGPHHRGQRQ